MFYVIRANKKGKWLKTFFGCKPGIPFTGIPLKVEADHALEQARKEHPDETYRLIYSEEEL